MVQRRANERFDVENVKEESRRRKARKKEEIFKKWGPCLKVKVGPIFLSLSLLRFLSLGAVKIMDCHAKWPDTRG